MISVSATARSVPVLIVGAGPFGLSLGAYARRHSIEAAIVGHPMGFWKAHMPTGMVLRSGRDWHLDPGGVDTIDAFLAARPGGPDGGAPLSLDLYLEYAEWFRRRQELSPRPDHVARLDRSEGRFLATMDAGDVVVADNVVVAVGFGSFRHLPADLVALLPPGRHRHTCDLVEPADFAGRRCLVVGGRQSAFESAALLAEAGAAAVHLTYRHDTPRFAPSDWTWFGERVDAMVDDPGWFRRLSGDERAVVEGRFWEEGRLKLEPWLGPRVAGDPVSLHPRTHVVGCAERAGALEMTLDDGTSLDVDEVVFATGYRPDASRVPFLREGNVWADLAVEDGFPCLDESFQTSVPGLFVTSMLAVRDFGSFFAFTISTRTSAQVIGAAIRERIGDAD